MKAFEEIQAEEFQDKITLPKADALVKVTTSWNGTGHIIRPILDELACQYHEYIKFYVLDHDKDDALTATYQVTTLPTILLFKKGTLVDKIVGMVNKTDMTLKIKSILN